MYLSKDDKKFLWAIGGGIIGGALLFMVAIHLLMILFPPGTSH